MTGYPDMTETALLHDNALTAKRVAVHEIPVIDLGPFARGSPEVRRRVAAAVDEACRNIGFFYVVNHGVPQPLIDRAFAEAKRFFDLPAEEKARIAIENSPCHRGWFALGGENLDPARQRAAGDLKEGVKIGQDLPADHPLVRAGVPLHGPNQWPEGLPGWKETWQSYYAAMCGLGLEIMHAFALGLGLDEDYFDAWLTLPMATAGPLHYPPQTGVITEARIGAGAHTDFGCLTVLAQDASGGLQVRNSAGEWLSAPVVPGSFVVNIGDMMARWTNDLYASTLHRVINTSGRDRYSIPFFYDPNHDTPVRCLETCTGPERPPRYQPTTSLQHLLDKIEESFTYF